MFVTGGASGTRAEIVPACAAQGCRVGILDIDEAASSAMVERTAGEVAAEICDLRDIDALRAVLDRNHARLPGRPDAHKPAAMCSANNFMGEAGSI